MRQAGSLLGLGNVWLGYYRSENGGDSFVSSLVPGYQGDQSPYAARAHVRTADSGDPVLAWDNHGRLFAGSESSGDPLGTAKTFGDVWVATYRKPQGPKRIEEERREGVRPLARRREGLGGAESAGQVPRQDRDRSRSHRGAM